MRRMIVFCALATLGGCISDIYPIHYEIEAKVDFAPVDVIAEVDYIDFRITNAPMGMVQKEVKRPAPSDRRAPWDVKVLAYDLPDGKPQRFVAPEEYYSGKSREDLEFVEFPVYVNAWARSANSTIVGQGTGTFTARLYSVCGDNPCKRDGTCDDDPCKYSKFVIITIGPNDTGK